MKLLAAEIQIKIMTIIDKFEFLKKTTHLDLKISTIELLSSNLTISKFPFEIPKIPPTPTDHTKTLNTKIPTNPKEAIS